MGTTKIKYRAILIGLLLSSLATSGCNSSGGESAGGGGGGSSSSVGFVSSTPVNISPAAAASSAEIQSANSALAPQYNLSSSDVAALQTEGLITDDDANALGPISGQ